MSPTFNINSIVKSTIIVGYDQLRRTLQLKEPDPLAKTNKIIVSEIPDECIVLRLDSRQPITNFLNNSVRGINSSCDYVILSFTNNNVSIVFCELKSDNPKRYGKQFLYTTLFCEYLIEITNKHFSSKLKIVNKDYVLFSTNNQRIKRSMTGKINSKELYGMKIKLAGNPTAISFKQLMS